MTSDIRTRILMKLIDNAKFMTLSDLKNELNVPHQLISYHLPILIDMGLIIKDGQQYYCQPVFIEPELQTKIMEKLSEFIPEYHNKIYCESDEDQDKKDVLINCLQIQMLLSIQSLHELINAKKFSAEPL